MRMLLLSFLLMLRTHGMEAQAKPNEYEHIHPQASKGMKVAFESSVIVFSIGLQRGASGSGNLVSIDGEIYIVTAAHVVEDSIFANAVEKNGNALPIEIVKVDKLKDVALLKPLKPLEVSKPARIKIRGDNLIGKPVVHCGHPASYTFNVSRGVISGYHQGYYLVSSMALPGASGSIVFGEKGDMIGIVSAVGMVGTREAVQLTDNLVFVVPVDYLYLRELLGEGGRVK
jgi:S1-C subfamily serine protease